MNEPQAPSTIPADQATQKISPWSHGPVAAEQPQEVAPHLLDHPHSSDDDAEVRAGLEAWAEQMEIYTGPDAMLDFNEVDYVHIDLTDANSSGVAQMFMGRKTRLSTILRDKDKREAGMVAARALRTKIFELSVEHGLDAGYFVAGTASWLSHDVREDGMVSEKRFIAPILMAPLSITPHPNGDDFEVKLTGAAQLNPAMVRQIKKEYGVDLGTMDVAQLANSMRKLDPEPVIERMRISTAGVPGMTIRSNYFISTFADLKESTGELPATAHTDLVREVARLKLNPLEKPFVAPIQNTREPVDTRDLSSDLLIFDADSAQQEVIDLANLGHSFTVTCAPGTDQLRTAINVAASLMNEGKSVLMVGEKRSTLADVRELVEQAGLDDLCFDVLSEKDDEANRNEFIQAVIRNENSAVPNLSKTFTELEETRAKLRGHTQSLRFTESRWGCSVYETLQTLAALTAQHPAPSTHVRLDRSTMDALTQRSATAQKLQRLAQLGGFDPSTRTSAWHRAKLVNTDETAAAHELAQNLSESLASLRAKMRLMADEAGIQEGATMEQWNAQLDLCERIADTLTRFRPDIFDRPVTDLIAATATGSWRREHGVDMSSMQRSRLRKVAKEYILPGVSIGDVHEQLFVVQSQREEWMRWVTDQRVPTVPNNLGELQAAYLRLQEEFVGLAIVLEDSPQGTDFNKTELSVLENRLAALINEEKLLHTLPERVDLLTELQDAGLTELLRDIYERQVPEDALAAELELAWWQTALEMMLQSHEIEILDGATLRDLETTFRRADYSFVSSGSARLHSNLAKLWKQRIESDEHGAAYLRSQLRSHRFELMQLLEQAGAMATSLLPLWLTSPFALSRSVPTTMRFDAVILLDAESTPLAANLPALTRAEQVIALGDPHSGFPTPFMVSAVTRNLPAPKQQSMVSTFDALSQTLPSRSLAMVNKALDRALFTYLNEHFYENKLISYPWGEDITDGAQALTIEVVKTEGKISDNANLDSPSPEVQRAAELVIEHAYHTPQQSLAVVTATPRHAQRIAAAVRDLLIQYPQFASFFAPGEEPFRVVDLTRAVDIERDVIIFALGAGKTSRGASHHFGALSERGGRQKFVLALTRARHLTRMLTCLTPEDLDPQRLEQGAFDIYRLLLAYRKDRDAKAAQALTAPITDKLPVNEFLRHDDLDAIDMGDWLLSDLVRRLGAQGVTLHEVDNNVMSLVLTGDNESLVAGAVASPRARKQTGEVTTRRVPLAVISDGTDAYAKMSVRERTRLLPELLARTGWNHMTGWTIEVFTDPETVVKRMSRYVGVEHEGK